VGTNGNLTYFYAKKVMEGGFSGHSLYNTKYEVHPNLNWMNKMGYNIYGDPTTSLFKEGVEPPPWEVPEDVRLTTATHDGNFGGYQAMNAWIQANGCEGYHVCDYTEVSRWMQTEGNSVFTEYYCWINSPGVYGARGNVGDCRGWTSTMEREPPGQSDVGTVIARTVGKVFPARHYCYSSFKVACCK
jgi:hypothetical protein